MCGNGNQGVPFINTILRRKCLWDQKYIFGDHIFLDTSIGMDKFLVYTFLELHLKYNNDAAYLLHRIICKSSQYVLGY